jgi:hypothetical protein
MALVTELLSTPYIAQCVGVVLLLVFLSSVWDDVSDEIPYAQFPLVGKSRWDLSNTKAKSLFSQSARALIAEGFTKVGGSSCSEPNMLIKRRVAMYFRSWLQPDH